MNLRDHDQNCRHGNRRYHDWPDPETGRTFDHVTGEPFGSCFGGAAVGIDYEAATLYALGDTARDGGLVVTYTQIRAIIDAAIESNA